MRQRLNENPAVQAVLIGVLGIIVVFLFMTRVMGGDEAEPAATTAPTTAADGTELPAGATAADAALATPTPAMPAAPAEPTTAAAGKFAAGPGLPGAVVKAHARGDVVALLITKYRGIDDRSMRKLVGALRDRNDVALFVVPASEVSRFSRVANGVDVNRVPALVVIEARRASDGALPTASVSYGFRGPDSITQTVRDAVYDGKQLPYHPG